jgi:integrase
LRPFFRWCEGKEYIQQSPALGLVPPRPLRKRERKLNDAELRAFWRATEQMTWRPLYRLLLLTAQRREEVSGIRWNELNLAGAVWTIPRERTKNNKEHVIHLSAPALEILRELDAEVHGPRDFLFPASSGENSVSGHSKQKERLDELMRAELGAEELMPWRIHDLRRTAASGMASLKFPPHIVERVLNHISGAQGGLVGVYQQWEYIEERKACIEAWRNHVSRLVA